MIWVLWRGALDVTSGGLTVGELVLLNTYIVRLLQPVEMGWLPPSPDGIAMCQSCGALTHKAEKAAK